MSKNYVYKPRTVYKMKKENEITRSKKENDIINSKQSKKENNIEKVTYNNIASYNNNYYYKRNIVDQPTYYNNNKNTKISTNNPPERRPSSNKHFYKKRDIVCPKCGGAALIDIKDYKITIYNCQYNHKTENILLGEFKASQKKGLSKIKCDNCLIMDKNNTEQNEFYRCLKCQINLCPKCKNKHDYKKHTIINYDLLFNICTKHNAYYINYCNKCKKNLCSGCLYEHKGHEIMSFQSLYESKNYIKYELDEMKSKIEQFNAIQNEIQKVLDTTKCYMDLYYDINSDMYNNCTKSVLNYEVLANLNKINENYKMPDIENLIKEKDISKQFSLIFEMYNKMTNKIDSKPNSSYEKANDRYKTRERIVIDSNNKTNSPPNDSQVDPKPEKIQPKFDRDTADKNYFRKKNNLENINNEKTLHQNQTGHSDALKKKNDSLKARNIKLNENPNINNEDKNNQNTNQKRNNYANEEKINKYLYSNINNNTNSQKSYANKENLRKGTYDNYSLKNKNETNNLNVMKNNVNNVEQKLPPPEVTELKSEAQKEQKEKEKEKQKETKNFVSTDKYGKKENILKNRLAEKIPIEVKEKEIEYTSSKKPKGLYNLGLSCYMNSLLQCLYHIIELRDFFIKEKNKFTNEKPVCKALAEVMYGLKYEKKDYFEAIEFKKIMGSKNSLFQGFKAGDAKDLFINLIDSLLTELTDENEDNDDIEENVDLTKKSDAFRITKEEIKDNIINNLFIGYYETIYKCKNSKKINTYAFSTESFISFNLEKITQYFQNRTLSIEDCFEYNYNRTYKTSFFCDKCKDTEENNSNDVIFVPPKIFVLVLDRGHGKTFRGKIDFKTDIDLEGLIDKKDNTNKFSTKYKLIGVSTHAGRSSSSGHYTACCLSDNGKYYYFSDTFVEEVSERSIYDNEPYLLFYKRYDTFSTPN